MSRHPPMCPSQLLLPTSMIISFLKPRLYFTGNGACNRVLHTQLHTLLSIHLACVSFPLGDHDDGPGFLSSVLSGSPLSQTPGL